MAFREGRPLDKCRGAIELDAALPVNRVKLKPSGLAAVVCLMGFACTRGNPAFLVETPLDRADAGGADSFMVAPPDMDIDPDPPRDATEVSPVDTTDSRAGPDAPSEAGPDSTLSLGLLVRYPLDPDQSDAVPDDTRTRTGTMHGGSGWTNLGFPGARFTNGGALILDGASGYVTLPTTGMPAVGAGKSVSLWFWQAAPSTRLRRTLLSLSNQGQSAGLHVGLQNGVPSVWTWAQLIGTAVVADDQVSPAGWTHVVFVQDGGTQLLYVNGARVDDGAVSVRSAPVTSFMLGAYAATGGEDERWTGRIDDVRIYGRALTASEIGDLAAGAP